MCCITLSHQWAFGRGQNCRSGSILRDSHGPDGEAHLSGSDRIWPTLTDRIEFGLTKFGQNYCFRVLGHSGSGPGEEGPKGGGPKGGRPKISLWLPCPAVNFIISCLSGGGKPHCSPFCRVALRICAARETRHQTVLADDATQESRFGSHSVCCHSGCCVVPSVVESGEGCFNACLLPSRGHSSSVLAANDLGCHGPQREKKDRTGHHLGPHPGALTQAPVSLPADQVWPEHNRWPS